MAGSTFILGHTAYNLAAGALATPMSPQPDTMWSPIGSFRLSDGNSDLQIVDLAFWNDGQAIAISGTTRVALGQYAGDWTERDIAEEGNGVAIADKVAIVVGSGGTVQISRNRGLTWHLVVVRPRANLRRIAFASSGAATAVGDGVVSRSDDGGMTWTRVSVPAHQYSDVAFAGNHGIAIGASGIVLRTANGGASWSALFLQRHGGLRSVAFANDTICVIVGGGGLILRSVNAGQHWETVASPSTTHYRSVTFLNDTMGIAVGLYGVVATTTDAGASWRVEESGSRVHLSVVKAATVTTAVAGGWFGTLLRRMETTQYDSAGQE